jgi:hypothetical protein
MRAASLRKNGPFLSCFPPMFVPSPSWQNVRFYISLIGSKEPFLLTDADDVAGIPAPCEKRLFLKFSLCLSQACLGKKDRF